MGKSSTKANNDYPVDERGYTDTPGAEKYGINSRSWLTKARHFGYGPEYVKFGKAVRYSYAALDAYANRNRRGSTHGDDA